MYGKTDWFFPDAELPPKGSDAALPGHESIIILNPNTEDARINIKLYWTDREPTSLESVTVKAERVKCLHCIDGEGFLGIPVKQGEQYAISLHSTVPVVAQYGRLDMRTGNMAFYTTPGYAE